MFFDGNPYRFYLSAFCNLINSRGTIPDALGKMTKLDGTFSLEGNNLKGSVPDSLGKLSRLETLDLRNNGNLCGPLDDDIEELSADVLISGTSINSPC